MKSITERTESKMNMWQSELNLAAAEFESYVQEEIFDFINSRENLCTAGFVLRRHLQIHFLELVNEAAQKSNVKKFANLTDSGNVAWPSEQVEALARILSRTKFKKFGDESLNIEWKQWNNYLSDKTRCQRDTAIKLIFALNMDEITAKKFLFSNGHELLSLRNPFEYACQVCLECGLTYTDAANLFDEFVKRRSDFNETNTAKKFSEDYFTRLIKNETDSVIENDVTSLAEIKEQILAAMLKYWHEFCKDKHDAGYSEQNLIRLRAFLKYLTVLYPEVERFTINDTFKRLPITTNIDGTPKIPAHLTTSMFDMQEIDLPEYSELPDYGGPDLPARGELKRFYDSIPFNRNILIPLRSLSQTLRSILRAAKSPVNAQAVDRDTIIFLTYFFIAGWNSANEDAKENFCEKLEADLDSIKKNDAQESLIIALSELVDVLDAIDEADEPLSKIYVQLINRMLVTFDFNEFYAPFALDRFILICLLSLDELDSEYLIQLVIYESHRLSRNMIERSEQNEIP